MKHTINITKEYKTEDLVNILADAMSGCAYWCSEIDYDENEYKEARARLKANGNDNICFEEVLVEMLENGKSIYFIDCEDDTRSELTLAKLMWGIKLNTEQRPWDCDLENGDAGTVDCIIQFALFNEVLFG